MTSMIVNRDNVDPESFTSEESFMSACILDEMSNGGSDHLEAHEVCASRWEENEKKLKLTPRSIVQKAAQLASYDGAEGMEFILSDATPDRYGDVINADGWVLDNFKRNPVALFNHNPDFPVGKWQNLGVKNGELRGHLRIAPAGTSDRHDEIRALVDAGILRAVSVGFLPLEYQPRPNEKWGDMYTKQELVETSLVAIPANPNALAVAKALKISDAMINAVFDKHVTQAAADQSSETTTEIWQGKKVPVTRYVEGVWRGKKIYRF